MQMAHPHLNGWVKRTFIIKKQLKLLHLPVEISHNIYMKTDKIFNKNYIILMIVNTLLFISFNMINPVLPEHVTGMGLSVTLAGIISGCFSITALVFRPISGIAADRLNPKKLYVIAGIGITIACVLYIFCTGFGTLLATRIFHGIFFAMDSTLALVLVAYFIPEDRMGEGIGLFGIGPIIAISFAPGLGIKICHIYGAEISFIIAAVTSLAATLCLLFISYSKAQSVAKAEVPEENQPVKKSFSIKRFIATEVIIFAALSGMFSFANSIEYTYMSLYSQSKGIEDISIYFTVSAAFILLTRLFAGKIYDKKGLSIILYPAFLVGIISMLVLGSATCITMFLIAAALKALAQGSGQPSLQSQSIVSVSKDRFGVASSTYYLGPDIMQGIGPVVGGLIIDHAGYEAAYYSCGILLFIGMIIYTIYIKKHKPI